MSEKIFVKPAEGCLVNMPERNMQQLPADGARVSRTQFWLRRLACGDVVETDDPKAEARAQAAADAKAKEKASCGSVASAR